MTDADQYYTYLRTRSRLGHFYRQYWLYPRLTQRLSGLTLDIGCGIGDLLKFRPGTIGVDINAHTVEFCKACGLDARVMTQDKLPFPDQNFDTVLLDNVLEHIPDPSQLLCEIRRVLKVGGILVVGVPGIRGWKADLDHKIEYNEEDLIFRMKKSKFVKTEIFFTPLFRSNWLSKKMRQYCIYGVFSTYTERKL